MKEKIYTVVVSAANTRKCYNTEGLLDCEFGPAIVFESGEEHWYRDNQLHREDGPASIYPDGTAVWYKNGTVHREDGPAIEKSGGNKGWFIEGKELTQEEFEKRTSYCVGKIVEIEGKKYRLVEAG